MHGGYDYRANPPLGSGGNSVGHSPDMMYNNGPHPPPPPLSYGGDHPPGGPPPPPPGDFMGSECMPGPHGPPPSGHPDQHSLPGGNGYEHHHLQVAIQNYHHGHLYFSFHVINEVHSQLLMRLYFFSAWRPQSRPSPASRSRIGFPGVHLDQLRPAWHAAATQSVQQHPRMIRTILHKHHCEVFINYHISVYIFIRPHTVFQRPMFASSKLTP